MRQPDYMPEMLPDLERDVNLVTDYSQVSAKAKALNQPKKKSSSNLNIPTISDAQEKITRKIRNTGTLPEKFPSQDAKVFVETGQEYLASALEETRNRISCYLRAYQSVRA